MYKKWWIMLRTTNISSFRKGLSKYLNNLEDGPIFIYSHNRPKAVLVYPELFNTLVEKVELLEDLVDGRRAVEDFQKHPDSAVDADDVFTRLGY